MVADGLGRKPGPNPRIRHRSRCASAEIVDLEDDTSTVLFVQFDDDPVPEAGWRMSTR
ncbi:MAG TPA: hypothetical protein VKH41_14200 [Myxococcota bacterium]|nr:hypothetical protein [Myxococcota bacterium]